MNIFRYILILPASVVIWFITLIVGMLCLDLTTQLFCNDASGMACFDPGWTLITDLYLSVFSGISAALILIVSALLAPEKKYETCLVVYGLGLITALIMAVLASNAWGPFFGAMILGAISMYLIQKVLNKKLQKM